MSEYLEIINRFRTDAAKLLPSSSSFSGVESALRTLQRQLTFTNTTTIINGALFAAFGGVRVGAKRKRHRQTMARGGDDAQGKGRQPQPTLHCDSFLYGDFVCHPCRRGTSLASLIVPLLGFFGSFQELTGGQSFPYRILSQQFMWSGILALILFVALHCADCSRPTWADRWASDADSGLAVSLVLARESRHWHRDRSCRGDIRIEWPRLSVCGARRRSV